MVTRFATGLICASLLIGAPAIAQETSDNQVATKTDWSVFEDKDPKECWAVSVPPKKDQVASRNGRIVSVRRGDIQLMAFFRPSAKVSGQIAYLGGFTFASGSKIGLDIDGTKFELYAEGEWAWAATSEDDAKIIAAMKRGAKAVLTSTSSRGTDIKDTVSLLGFTAALNEAEKRCNG